MKFENPISYLKRGIITGVIAIPVSYLFAYIFELETNVSWTNISDLIQGEQFIMWIIALILYTIVLGYITTFAVESVEKK